MKMKRKMDPFDVALVAAPRLPVFCWQAGLTAVYILRKLHIAKQTISHCGCAVGNVNHVADSVSKILSRMYVWFLVLAPNLVLKVSGFRFERK